MITNLVTDYIQKRRGEPGVFFFGYNLLSKLISNFLPLHGPSFSQAKTLVTVVLIFCKNEYTPYQNTILKLLLWNTFKMNSSAIFQNVDSTKDRTDRRKGNWVYICSRIDVCTTKKSMSRNVSG